MSWIPWRRGSVAGSALAARLAAWRARAKPPLDASLNAQRVVVLDVESSGLDPWRDRLISIGAVAVRGGLVRLDETFYAVLRQAEVSADGNIVVHRLGAADQLGGRAPAEALLDFLEFAATDPLVAHHADFDRMLIERATRAELGVRPRSEWLDLACLAPALFRDRAPDARTLDDWLAAFAIENAERHNALSDAVATAHLLLAVLARARQQGIADWAKLRALQEGYAWLGGR